MKQGPRRQQSVADRERQKAAISSPVQLFPQLGDWESAIQSEGQNVRLRQALTSASSHPGIQHSLSTYVILLSGDASGRNLCKPLIEHEDAASLRIFVHRFEAVGLLQNLTSCQRHYRPATEICSAATRACTKPYETVRSHKAASPE